MGKGTVEHSTNRATPTKYAASGEERGAIVETRLRYGGVVPIIVCLL